MKRYTHIIVTAPGCWFQGRNFFIGWEAWNGKRAGNDYTCRTLKQADRMRRRLLAAGAPKVVLYIWRKRKQKLKETIETWTR